MFQTGYILSRRADSVWFLALPFVAVAAALACQQWLTAVAMASVALWVTIPHHFATWVRAFSHVDDRRRWRARLIGGPIVIVSLTLAGLVYAPITMLLLAILWDKQHSLMQQHGFSRIYDFKAGTGSPSTPKFDLYLHWILFGNLFLTSPFFTPMWLRELYRLHLPLSAPGVQQVHLVSWSVTGVYLVVYSLHLLIGVRSGHRLNPVKYLFIAASYFLWYFTAWHVASVLVFTIASRLMHGIQYIVIAYCFTQKRIERSGDKESLAARLLGKGKLKLYLAISLAYALVYQLIIGESLSAFGFGFLDFSSEYKAVPSLDLAPMSQRGGYELFAALVIECCSLIHFYYDSFIWKVRDPQTQKGL